MVIMTLKRSAYELLVSSDAVITSVKGEGEVAKFTGSHYRISKVQGVQVQATLVLETIEDYWNEFPDMQTIDLMVTADVNNTTP